MGAKLLLDEGKQILRYTHTACSEKAACNRRLLAVCVVSRGLKDENQSAEKFEQGSDLHRGHFRLGHRFFHLERSVARVCEGT